MDEMRIQSKFLTKLISKAISRHIKKSKDLNLKINLRSVSLQFDGDNAKMDIDGTVYTDKETLDKLLNKDSEDED